MVWKRNTVGRVPHMFKTTFWAFPFILCLETLPEFLRWLPWPWVWYGALFWKTVVSHCITGTRKCEEPDGNKFEFAENFSDVRWEMWHHLKACVAARLLLWAKHETEAYSASVYERCKYKLVAHHHALAMLETKQKCKQNNCPTESKQRGELIVKKNWGCNQKKTNRKEVTGILRASNETMVLNRNRNEPKYLPPSWNSAGTELEKKHITITNWKMVRCFMKDKNEYMKLTAP